MGKSKGPKWYAVRSGRIPGVYATWSECEVQTKGFSGAVFKSFQTKVEAEKFVDNKSVRIQSDIDLDQTSKKQRPNVSIGTKRNNSELGVTCANTELRYEDGTCDSKKARGNHDKMTIVINFDGASRGNPGMAGAGTYLKVKRYGREYYEVFKIRKYLGTRETNNVAEYHGLIQGLKQAFCIIQDLTSEQSSMISLVNVIIRGDSNLIINQMKKIYKCKHTGLMPLYKECHCICTNISEVCHRHGLNVEMHYDHVFREKNIEADTLANEAIDRQKSWTEVINNVQGNDGSSVSRNDSKGEGSAIEFVDEDV